MRVVHFGEALPADIHAWLCLVGYSIDQRKISDDYIADTSNRHGGFDVLLICGSDAVRLRKFLRYYKPVLTGKAKIALLPASRPRARAGLLNSGFDDVFDLKMHALEARMRIGAILGRLSLLPPIGMENVVPLGSRGAIDVSELAFDRLTPREAKLLGILAAKSGQAVPISEIVERLSAEGKPVRVPTIRVTISKIRQKLHDNVKVHANEHFTYTLSIANFARRT